VKVLVSAPGRAIEASVRKPLDAAGHETAAAVLPQDLCSALYREKDAAGIVVALNAAYAAHTVQQFRMAGVGNILFVLLDFQESHHAALALILRCGADDAQAFPLDARELVARLTALSRRGRYRDHLKVRLPGCSFDVETGVMTADDGRRQHLSPTLGRLFAAIAINPDRILSKADLMDHMYGGGDDEPNIKIIDVLVCKLRHALAEMTGGLDVVETLHSRGYRFVPDGYRPQVVTMRRRGRAS
jgi:two-component system, cell cycle response regulator CtrA